MNILNTYHTLKHLKPIQMHFQLWYRVRKVARKLSGFRYPLMHDSKVRHLQLQPGIVAPESFDHYRFTFLNDTLVAQKNKIPWNDAGKGRLWAYNLNYMDFLNQDNMDADRGCELITDFIQHQEHNSTGNEPYTIALRGINWIKFLCQHFDQESINRQPIRAFNHSLLAQYFMLMDQIEYHLMANHLLEDAFSLLFGSLYFEHEPMYLLAEKLLSQQLEEQILPDGAHFELSPMYHQLLLARLLDCINLLQHNPLSGKTDDLLRLMESKALLMTRWIQQMTFADGSVPLFNDAAPGIAPDTTQLLQYADRLLPGTVDYGKQEHIVLKESNYRRFDAPRYCCIVDVGGIAPDYQPGHAHADSFSFVLHVDGRPLLTDPGVSTYNPGIQRLKERSTAMHNTVTVNNENSSAVWSGFRVGRRARVQISGDSNQGLTASHDGFRHLGTTHQRGFSFSTDNICIEDTLSGKIMKGVAHFWLHPGEGAVLKNNIVTTNRAKMTFSNVDHILLTDVEIPTGYNQQITTKKIEVVFEVKLKTNIDLL